MEGNCWIVLAATFRDRSCYPCGTGTEVGEIQPALSMMSASLASERVSRASAVVKIS